jgi:GH24 family phage-related lysozyme (muramidase)
MNLIQVQDRLKDMPTQAIMSYANGSNPEVPPYLALGELNRRKQMEQKQVQAPQGTVKDQIEQSVKLAQAQKAAQAQGQQKMTEAMGAQQSPVPGGTPQPQEQPEAGIAQLPTGPMNFRDGGIVSFANEGLVRGEDEDFEAYRNRVLSAEKAAQTARENDEVMAQESARQKALQGREKFPISPFMKRPPDMPTPAYERLKALDASRYVPESTERAPTSTDEVNAMINGSQLGQAPRAQRGPSAAPRPSTGGAGGRAPGGAPQAGGPSVAVDPLAKLMERIEGQTTQLPKSPDELRAERAKTDQYLNTLPGSRLEELHAQIAKRDEEDRARFLKNEEERKQGRLNRGLMAGAEATRGQGGLGALGSFFMGFNKANEAEDESARTRMDAQRVLERQQEVLRAEVLSKVEDARIARSEGRLKDAVGYEKEAAAAQNQLNQTKLTQLTSLAQAIETRRHNIATEEGQREQLKYSRMAASRGPEIEQVFGFLSKQFPDKDPKALLDMALQYSGVGARLQAADTAAITKADAAFEKQNALAITQANIQTDPAKKKKMEDDLEVKRAAFRQSYQASGGIGGLPVTPQNVIKVDANGKIINQ